MYFSIWMLYFLVMEPLSFSSLFVSAFFPLVGWSILNLIRDCSGGRICCVKRSCSAARWSRLEAEARIRPMAATELESIFLQPQNLGALFHGLRHRRTRNN